ncbi:MAG: lysylphosphatidylglycerol synthase domain-containing protein [Pseudonocardiales bacterium]
MTSSDGPRDDGETVTAPEPMGTNRRRAALGILVVTVVVGAACLAIYSQRHSFADALQSIGGWPLLASLVVGMLSVALTLPAWLVVLHGLGVEMSLAAGARVFFVSQLGKYLPGSVWPVLIQMEAGRARGASRRTMLAANLITLILSCAACLTLACLLLPLSGAPALEGYWWLLAALPFLLGLLHPRAVPWLLDRAFGLLGRAPLALRLHLRDSARASAWALLAFVVLGMHVAILALAIDGGGVSTVLLCIGGTGLAVTAGVLFVPAPAGAGVRDAVLALVLSSTLNSGQALAVVVASRAILILADVLLAAAAALTLRRAAAAPSQ